MGTAINKMLEEIGEFSLFGSRFFKEISTSPFQINEFIRQCYAIGYKSLPLVTITGFIMGLVLTIQSRPTMTKFGAESWLPSMVSLSLIREIAPVITALICAGKIASGIGAELGAMKVTEQIDAMEVSAINPGNTNFGHYFDGAAFGYLCGFSWDLWWLYRIQCERNNGIVPLFFGCI